MPNKNFDIEEAYLEIFLTKTISKDDLVSLLTSEGISFDKNFDLNTAKQFDLGTILINDVPKDRLITVVTDLQKNKYPNIKSVEEIRLTIDSLVNLSEIEIAKYYLKISNSPMKGFVEDFLAGKNKESVNKNDLLFFVMEELIKR